MHLKQTLKQRMGIAQICEHVPSSALCVCLFLSVLFLIGAYHTRTHME